MDRIERVVVNLEIVTTTFIEERIVVIHKDETIDAFTERVSVEIEEAHAWVKERI